MYLSLSLECIQNTSGREPPCAPASSIVQYSSHLTTEISVLIPVFSVKSARISLIPGSWLVSQMDTESVTSSPFAYTGTAVITMAPANNNAATLLKFITSSSFLALSYFPSFFGQFLYFFTSLTVDIIIIAHGKMINGLLSFQYGKMLFFIYFVHFLFIVR